jgi:hypothetical protein
MAKKRVTVGQVIKGRNGKSDYIQIRKDLKEPLVLKAGQFLNLESSKDQIKSLEDAAAVGKLSTEWVEQQVERLKKTPEFVRFQVTMTTESEAKK